jgi:hypothetical protein
MRPTLEICCFGLLAALAAAAAPRAASAVVVLKKGVEAPLMGHLVRADDRALVIRQELPGGKSRDVTIARSEIDDIVETVSRQRLAELNPANPATYLEYAEELAEKRRDPEARDTARRLLTIAASRGDASLRHSSLLTLADLARTAGEHRRLKALLYLTDPRHDSSILSSSAHSSATNDSSAQAELLSAFRHIRQGQGAAAKAILEKKPVQDELASEHAPFTLAELTALSKERTLTDTQLARLLRAELAMEAESTPQASADQSRWSKSANTSDLTPVLPLNFDHLTEFDPTECLYKNGQWQRP